MTASAHTNRVIVDGVSLQPSTLDLDIDEFRNPYARATFTVPLPDEATLARLDPRESPRALVSMRQTFGTSRPVSAISADYAGQVVEALSVVPDTVNADPSFEMGTAGWAAKETGTTVTHTDEQAHTGTYSLSVSNPAGESAIAWTADMFPIDTLVRWYRRAWLYPTTELTGVSFRTYFYDADMVEYEWAGVGLGSLPVGEWTQLDSVLNVLGAETENYHYARLEMRLTGTNPHAYVDDAAFQYGRSAISSLSSEYGDPYNAGGFRPSTDVRAALWLRNRSADYAAGTVELEATTQDALLADYALLSPEPLAPAGPTVRDCCNLVLGHVLGDAVQDGETGSERVDSEALDWQPGEGAWDYLQGIVGSAGLRLWPDEVGLWHLEDPQSLNAPGQLSLSANKLIGMRDGISRDQDQWADGVVVTYEWDDANGERQTRHDVAGPPDASRVIRVTIERPFPGRGLAAARLRRAQAMGRILALDAVADYGPRPFHAARVEMPGGPVAAGYVSGVAWSQPADTMSVRTRDFITIGPNAWLYTPAAISWDDDSLTGISWDDYTRTPTEEI